MQWNSFSGIWNDKVNGLIDIDSTVPLNHSLSPPARVASPSVFMQQLISRKRWMFQTWGAGQCAWCTVNGHQALMRHKENGRGLSGLISWVSLCPQSLWREIKSTFSDEALQCRGQPVMFCLWNGVCPLMAACVSWKHQHRLRVGCPSATSHCTGAKELLLLSGHFTTNPLHSLYYCKVYLKQFVLYWFAQLSKENNGIYAVCKSSVVS